MPFFCEQDPTHICARSTVIAPSLVAAAIDQLATFVELIAAVLMMHGDYCGDKYWRVRKQGAKAAYFLIFWT